MKSTSEIILSTAYFPNIQYFSKILYSEKVLIENDETFPKQTYRNRCVILGANGVQTLVVPVIKGRSGKIKTKDIQISYAENWQNQHLQTIKSAYASSPFFDFYIDEIEALIKKRHKYIIDLNLEILNELLSLISIKTKILLTNNFVAIDLNNKNDYRFSISPKSKHIDKNFTPSEYIQVFSDRNKFVSNLSILDLIFNLGQESKSYLKQCITF